MQTFMHSHYTVGLNFLTKKAFEVKSTNKHITHGCPCQVIGRHCFECSLLRTYGVHGPVHAQMQSRLHMILSSPLT